MLQVNYGRFLPSFPKRDNGGCMDPLSMGESLSLSMAVNSGNNIRQSYLISMEKLPAIQADCLVSSKGFSSVHTLYPPLSLLSVCVSVSLFLYLSVSVSLCLSKSINGAAIWIAVKWFKCVFATLQNTLVFVLLPVINSFVVINNSIFIRVLHAVQ